MSNVEMSDSSFDIGRATLQTPWVNILRLCLAAFLIILTACSSWGGGKNKPSARMYEGDTSPVMNMHEESPGGPLNN